MRSPIHGTSSVFVAVLSALCFSLVAILSSPAAAQERQQKKSLIQLLFGPKETKKAAPRSPSKSSRPRGNKRASAPKVEAVEKAENASKILVLGDFMAGGLADGLEVAYAQSPNILVVKQTSGSSGLVRDDYYNWPQKIVTALEEHQPELVIFLIGSNDRQKMNVAGDRVEVKSLPWKIEYRRRVGDIVKAAQNRKVPLLWVGTPAFSSGKMTADMLSFNLTYRNEVEKLGAEFVDIWDGFVDEDGKFIFTGSDIKGQQVRLRTSDGINLTAAGRRKLAFYAEKPIARLLGDPTRQTAPDLLDEEVPDLALFGPIEPEEVIRTLPIAFDDPDFDGGTTLLGAYPPTAGAKKTLRDRLVIDGELAPAPFGRADNFGGWDVRNGERITQKQAPINSDNEPIGAIN